MLLKDDKTALMLAAVNGREEVVLELLRAGANVNEKDEVSELLTYYCYCCFILLFVVVG